jgi:hypothetical protein
VLFELAEGGEGRIKVVKRARLTDLYGALPATRPYPGKAAVRAAVGHVVGQRRARTVR